MPENKRYIALATRGCKLNTWGRMITKRVAAVAVMLVLLGLGVTAQRSPAPRPLAPRQISEINQLARPASDRVIAIVGATLIDGKGGSPLTDAAVVVKSDTIISSGPRKNVPIPQNAEIVRAEGMTASSRAD